MTVTLATCLTYPELTDSDRVLAAALRARDVPVRAVPWESIVPGSAEAGTVCLRSTWNYHRESRDFDRWIRQFLPHRGMLLNPPETVLSNMDKIYLLELLQAGIEVPDAIWLDPGERLDPDAVMAERGWDRAVLKPRISGTAYGTWLLSRGMESPEIDWSLLRESGGLLQRFVPEIRTGGEISLVFLDGRHSHAVRKRPVDGDFRVQSEFGGIYSPIDPEPALIEFGRAALDVCGLPWLYARVDVVETPQGPTLMELELIEPELFFHIVPEGAGRLADALLRHTAGRGA